MKNYFSQKCPHCGNMMYISTSSKKVVCLNCDKEFEVDKDLLKKFNEEKEEKIEKSKKRKKMNKQFDSAVLYAIVGILVFFGLIFSLIKNVEKIGNKDIKISYSSHYFRNEKLILEDVIKKLKKNGFTNMEYEAVYDVGFLSKYKEMQVEKVEINGLDIYTKNDKFPKDSKIIIYYHDDIDKDPKKNMPNYYGTFIGDDRSIIMIGKDESVYYFKGTSMYDKEVICNEENNKIVLDVKSLGYKLYFDKKSNYDNDFEVKSTNENWNTEKFIKYSDEVNCTKNDMDRIITSSKALKRMRPEIIKKELQNDGFINVVLVPDYDVYFGWIAKTGDVISISINGETQFDSYLDYPKNSIIKIYYHEESSKDPSIKKSETNNG